jgi:hypothetical protein
LTKAITLLVNGGLASIEDVATLGGWPVSSVRAKKQIIDFRRSIEGAGGPELPDSVVKHIATHASQSDFESAPVVIASFCNDLKTMKMTGDEAAPYVEIFFSVRRTSGKVFNQFTANLEDFRNDDDIIYRLADPKRRLYQTMTPDGKIGRALKSTLTTIENIIQSRDMVFEMGAHFTTSGMISKSLRTLDQQSKKGARANGRKKTRN